MSLISYSFKKGKGIKDVTRLTNYLSALPNWASSKGTQNETKGNQAYHIKVILVQNVYVCIIFRQAEYLYDNSRPRYRAHKCLRSCL